uniref:F-box domain-containing protein n=1 Tax=Leersia perrieri TaxID=77586 RepID=A0A0D9UYV4_9ORYZ
MDVGSSSGSGRGVKRRRDGDEGGGGGGGQAADAAAEEDSNYLEMLPADMKERILAILPLDDAVRTSVLSPAWRDAVRRLLDGNRYAVDVVFTPHDNHERTVARLESAPPAPAPHVAVLSIVVSHAISSDDAWRVRRLLFCASPCTVEHLYVHLRAASTRNKVTFYFDNLSPLLRTLTLRRINFTSNYFNWRAPPFPYLTSIHLNSVGVRDDVMDKMVTICPNLRVLKLVCCTRLRNILVRATNLRFFTVAECENLEKVMVVDCNRLRSYHYSGRPNSFFIPPTGLLDDLYICTATAPMAGQVVDEWTWFRNSLPFLSRVTALTICSNCLKILYPLHGPGANAALANAYNFQSMREIQLLMFELKAVDLDNIYVFLNSCRRPNLTKFFVQLPAVGYGPFEEDFFDNQQEELPNDGLDNLEVAKIKNFNWRRYDLQLLVFLLRKTSSVPRLLIVSPRNLRFEDLGLQQADLSLIQAALNRGQLILETSDNDAVCRPFHSTIYKEF